MKLCIIIPAAGASRRYSDASKRAGVEAPRSKLDEELGGRPVLQRSVELFTTLPQVLQTIVAGPADPDGFAAFKLRYGDKLGLLGCELIPGGRDERYQTVQLALAKVRPEITHVAIHDGARPCASPELIQRLLDAAARFPAVIPGIDVADTLKRVGQEEIAPAERDPLASILGDGPSKGYRAVTETIDRKHAVAVQTPQIFERELILKAYGQKDLRSTDDAQLVERLGQQVIVVPGDVRNIKITRPEDLTLARAILNVKPPEERPSFLKF